MLKMHVFRIGYAALVLTRFDWLFLTGPRATPNNLRKLAAFVKYLSAGSQCVGSVANENQSELRGF